MEAISRRWREGRAARREAIEALEGEAGVAGVQDFLAAVNTLAGERRLSRYVYLAYRTRGKKKGAAEGLQLQTTHRYEEPGDYTIMVKVIDLLGNDTTKTVRVKVV